MLPDFSEVWTEFHWPPSLASSLQRAGKTIVSLSSQIAKQSKFLAILAMIASSSGVRLPSFFDVVGSSNEKSRMFQKPRVSSVPVWTVPVVGGGCEGSLSGSLNRPLDHWR